MVEKLKMGKKQQLLLLLILVVELQLQGYNINGCSEKERIGLLGLKDFFTKHRLSMDPLTSWSGSSNCCQWSGVQCHPVSALTIDLSLTTLLNNDDSIHPLIYFFDASLLRPFHKLESLDLSYNGFSGFTNHQYFNNLRELMLSNNKINDSKLLQGLCKSNKLVRLDLSSNQISGQFPPCLLNLSSLEFLDISSNQFTGILPPTISNLKSIKILQLDDNNFEGPFSFSSLANLSKLKVFQLSTKTMTNNLQVETENPSFSPTFQLNVLKLSNCNLNTKNGSSNIPNFLSTQHHLKFVDLSHNNLVGTVPVWLLQNNTNLDHLILTNNSLIGNLQLPSFKHPLTNLKLSCNSLSGQLPSDMGFLLPNLVHFNISRNNFEGNLPSSITTMRSLNIFDLSNNRFSGKLQMSMFSNMSQLSRLQLRNNNFSGSIEDGVQDIPDLIVLDISKNLISGKIPHWIGSLTNLLYLQVAKNHLQGKLSSKLCSLHYLKFLDVSQNQLSGPIPSCFNLPSLKYLYMQDNNFSGPIPKAFSRSSELTVLDLSRNSFSGRIPNWISRCSSLRFLLLKGNHFRGLIPRRVCELREMSIMDVSSNELKGAVPSCLSNMSFGVSKWAEISPYESMGSSFISVFSVELDVVVKGKPVWWSISHENKYSEGQIQVDFITKNRSEQYKGSVLLYMAGLDLSSNQLTGNIPLQIGELQKVHALNFSHNKFEGRIPNTICNLKELESLDLSYNFLNGDIPSKLSELDFLSFFNVSYNNLSGMIPISPHFKTFLESSYLGNPNLCGPLVGRDCSGRFKLTPNNRYNDFGDEDGRVIYVEGFYWSFIVSYFTILLGLFIVLFINPRWRNVWFYFVDVCCSYLCECI
ncbi:probable LRR receptor-like serine/threonine-protein kinase At1g34110 [Momordica charantia]|uniref:Probable LRR receptor-like serine/threonine-protein kinase At1g34110 n=1 Tax=Momordica charantia TaxID=3673 RepID=A0A6J1D4Z7_MOMCH|nr:probable LRR receptor-like serine/threonine-protein kinase At1g34110 [Momordica charantia]